MITNRIRYLLEHGRRRLSDRQAYLARQLLFLPLQERGARCPSVALYSVFYSNFRVSIVMELMDRGSLLVDVLDDGRTLTLRRWRTPASA